ncbi:MAG: signal peptidase II [Paracoccaceae bacterium]|jgi:signal peptidase II|uniref:signal peptidase II n=1 Tax=Sulfitobacter sp. SK025 TaxID=1389011 RepID=UPI000E0AFDDE|nr:signal peptidase II [Sulfitobacter sp. SK025]AXI52796.1 signal peptidase II [Sulfitobacter sp. SK025]
MNNRVLGGLCAIAAFGLDQGTKALALNTPALEHGVEVLPFLNLVRVLNDGVSFGMLGGIVPWWGLVVLATAIMAGLLIWLWRAPDRLTAAALGLVIGGALGNVIDRLRYQAVPDFLDFHFGTYHWPSFNLADVAIFCGAALLFWDGFRATKDKPGHQEQDQREGNITGR